jgi:glycosyltransferase involved in cell wall biosynthesis
MARFRGPVVFVGHGATEKDRKIAEAAAENGATHFAAVSQAAAEFLPDGVRHDVIHNGVDLSRCLPVRGRKAVRASWGVEDDDVCVGFVGRPHPEKHPDLVVEACSLLPDRHRPVFIGDVQPHDQRRLSSLGRKPIFSGRVDQIGDALAGLDCMMLPSEHEAMSLSVVEAWAAGVPVVATPVGAIPELEDRHGALVEQIPVGCSAKEASAAIMRATAVQHRPVADRACRLAREEFSLEAMGRRWTTYLLAVRAARSDLDQSPVTIHHEPSTLRKRRWTMDAKRFSDAAARAAKIVRGSAANVMSRVTSRKSVARPEPVEDPAESKIGTRIVQGDADPEAVEAPPRRAGIAAAASRWWLGNGEPAAKEPKTISVAVVTPTLQSAGAERWAVSLAKSIQGDGIECAGLLELNPSHAADPSMSARARESCRLLTMEDDVSIVRQADAIVMWGYAKLPKEFGEYHGMLVYASHSSTPEGGQIAMEASKHVHHLVAVSKKCAEHIPPQCSCTIIHNGVDLARCEPRVSRLDMRKWWGAGQDDILVAYVGRWHADKHLEKVGEACRELGEFYRPVYVGSMTLREECRLAKVNPRSVFAGYVPHIGDALGAVDVVCLLSDHEAMSLTLCEAWAAGVPVVCTAVGAVPELQEMFGEVAKLVESKLNVKTIAGQIETALSPHSRPMVVRAREMARTYCSEEAMGRRWRAFIRRCMLERDSDE